MKSKLAAFIAAAFGGISPNLLRLAVSLMREESALPGLTYLLGLLIFAIMGGVVAYIWEETDLKKAFYLGIGLPALIQMGAGEISKQPVAMWQGEPAPYAAILNQPAAVRILPAGLMQETPRMVTVNLDIYRNVIAVLFLQGDSTLIAEEQVVFKNGQMKKMLTIPDRATAMQVRVGSTYSNRWNLPDDASPMRCTVLIEESIWRGLFQALGFGMEPVSSITIRGS